MLNINELDIKTKESLYDAIMKWKKESDFHFLPIDYAIYYSYSSPETAESMLRFFIDQLFEGIETEEFSYFKKKKRKYLILKRGNYCFSKCDGDLRPLLYNSKLLKRKQIYDFFDEEWPDLDSPLNKDENAGKKLEFYESSSRFGPDDDSPVIVLFDIENCSLDLLDAIVDDPLFIKNSKGKVFALSTGKYV